MTIRQELARFGRELAGRPEVVAGDIERSYNREWQGFVDAYLRYQGGIYQPGFTTTIPGQKAEPVLDSFVGYVQGAYKTNGVVFAVSMARSYLFTDVTFKWRRYGQSGGGNDLFGNAELSLLERPWPGGTTQQLLTRAEQDVTAAGTFFVAREGDRLRRLRPDWCEFILSAPPLEAVQSDVVGIKYTVGGPHSGGPARLYLVDAPEGVNKDGYAAFWSPIPDPDAQYRGMSWLTPVLKDKMADQAATDHKLAFFENAATPNLAVALKDTVTPEQFKAFVRTMNEASAGVDNAYKTLFVGGGADVTVIGADMNQLDFRNTQGAGETRICAAGRVPPIIVGLSEGLSAATYSNYAQARRAFGDSWARPQWKSFAGSIEPLLDAPRNAAGVRDAQLWYDVADVAFLREDLKDLADVMSTTVGTINAAIAAGWTPESAQKAILAEDLGLLVHSGLVSVQLQPPGGPADADTTQQDATAELTAKVGNIASLAPPGAFDPESVVEAVNAGDLSKLDVVEVEEDPALAEDPEVDPAVLEEDLANEALRGRHEYVRDADGQLAHIPGGSGKIGPKLGPIADPLKLSTRIKLEPGETFAGSARVHDRRGDQTTVLARVETEAGPRFRVGIVRPEDTREWRAADKGGTVELDRDGAENLRHVIQDALAEGKANVSAYRAGLREANKAGTLDDIEWDPEAEIAKGTVTGARWGDIAWELTREEGDEYLDLGPGGSWSLGLSIGGGEPFYLDSPAAVGKLDKALANLIGAS